MSVPVCWNSIVGITRKDDTCIDISEAPADYNISLSNLYLDELQGINMRFLEEADSDYWNEITRAYENAIRTFQMDLMGELLKTNKKKYDHFIGNIGSQKFKNNLNLNKTYAGVRLYMNDIKGATFKLKAIGLLLNTTATFDMSIYSNLDDTALYTFTVNSVANKYIINNFAAPYELLLSDDEYSNLEYRIVYPRGLMQPKDNQVTCGCGGVKWCFNTQYPCFGDAKLTKDRWRQYVMVGGIQGDDLTDFDTWTLSGYMNGIVLIGEFTCDNFLYLCNDNSDWENNDVDKAIAYALQYKWGEFVMNMFLDTTEVTRLTTLGVEAINNNRTYYNNRYAVMIQYIVDNIDIGRFGCLSCKPAHGFALKSQML
jgi:hypothetical protein